MQKINKLDLFFVSFRSFFLQSIWNFKKMQNIGFAFCLLNILKKIYTNNDDYKKAVSRHLEFFNIHPYMIGIILGIIIKLEENNSKSKLPDINFINKIKTSLSTTLSAIGDSFIWGIWRPLVFLTIFFLWLTFNFFTSTKILLLNFHKLFTIIFLVLYIFLYNSLHFFLRFYCIYISNKIDLEIMQYIQKWKKYDIEIKVKKIGFLITLFSLILFFHNQKFSFFDIIVSLIILFVFFILKNTRRWKVINMILALFIIVYIIITVL